MQIALRYENDRNKVLTLSPEELDLIRWAKRKGTAHRPYEKTNLPHPFKQVFLKRWIDARAPAHDLLAGVCGKKLPGTPTIFGLGNVDSDWIYVFERVPDSYKDLHHLLSRQDGSKYVTAKSMGEIAEKASGLFDSLEQHKYLYTDFSMKNILVDPANFDPVFIDLDSAWSYDTLKDNNGKSAGVDRYYWRLWNDHILAPVHPALPSAKRLPRSIVISFVAAWVHALNLLNSSSHSINAATDFIRAPDGQKQLWEALAGGRKDIFREYLGLDPAQAGELFTDWRDLYIELRSPRPVEWSEIRQATANTAAFLVKPSKPPNQPPSVSVIPKASIEEETDYEYIGSFSDPDPSSWTATVDYGDGTGVLPFVLFGRNFKLSHEYTKAGTYTITVAVTDDQGATGSATALIAVTPRSLQPSVPNVVLSPPPTPPQTQRSSLLSHIGEGVRLGIIDPFYIMRLTGKLESKTKR